MIKTFSIFGILALMCVLTVYFFRLDRIKFNYIGPKTCYRIWGEGTMNEHVTNLPYFQNINRFLVFIDFGMADSRESKAKDCVKEKSLDECIKGDDKDNIVRNFHINSTKKLVYPFTNKETLFPVIANTIKSAYAHCMADFDIKLAEEDYPSDEIPSDTLAILVKLDKVDTYEVYKPYIEVGLYRAGFTSAKYYGIYKPNRRSYDSLADSPGGFRAFLNTVILP